MPNAAKLIEEILKQRPDLSEATLRQKIDEKKKKVGGGYLSDAGACWLVASDLGVSLENSTSAHLTLGDLYIGANELTVSGKVFTVYPMKKYLKKDGSEGRYTRLTVFDNVAFAKVTVWDDKNQFIRELRIKPGSSLKIVHGYVKAGLDGRPVLNVGGKGSLEIDENNNSALPTIDQVTKDVGSVRSAGDNLSISGHLASEPRLSEFSRKNGSTGKMIQLHLRSPVEKKDYRIILWEYDLNLVNGLEIGSFVRMCGVRSKATAYGEIEFHGDEGTLVENLPGKKIDIQPPFYAEVKANSTFRILSIGIPKGDLNGFPSVSTFVVDSKGQGYTMIFRDNAYRKLSELKDGRLIECSPRQISQDTLICNFNSDLKTVDNVRSFPSAIPFEKKIDRLKESSGPTFMEVLALSRASTEEITTKEGVTVKKAEVIIGDETGEVKLVAWRNLVENLDGIAPGQRLLLKAVIPQLGREGSTTLLVRSYSSIEKIDNRAN